MRILPVIVAVFVLATSARTLASAYDTLILSDQPSLYLSLGATQRVTWEPDLSGHSLRGQTMPQYWYPEARMPNGDKARIFDGSSQYIEVASAPGLSVPTTGVLTIETWIRPDVLNFPKDEGDGYVHFAGKGASGEQEYVLRMYSKDNTANPPRPNRISGYAFNPDGGLGSGSYFQDAISVGEWIHVVVVINAQAAPNFPRGYVKIFKNGILRKTTGLEQFDVTPGAGSAPLRIGTRDLRSFFKGAMGKFAVYGYELSEPRLRQHFDAMRPARPRFPIDLGGRLDHLKDWE